MNNCDMRTLLLLFITLMLTSCAARKAVSGVAPQENIIILYEPDAGNKALIKEAEKYGSKILYVYKNINGIAVTVPKGKTVDDAIKHFKNVKGVLSVTEDKVMQLD